MSLPAGLLIFDMDGVLVDVTHSYRAAIIATVEHFAGFRVTNTVIQEFKNLGGWNDDWALSFHIIREAGVPVEYDVVVRKFQKFFRGESGYDGLIRYERWVAEPGLFDRLARVHRLAVFTGRLHEEANVTLSRYASGVFGQVVGADDVRDRKPSPTGINMIRAGYPARHAIYVGDTIDDARCARAADVKFIGIVSPSTPRRDETIDALEKNGAIAILETVNAIEQIL